MRFQKKRQLYETITQQQAFKSFKTYTEPQNGEILGCYLNQQEVQEHPEPVRSNRERLSQRKSKQSFQEKFHSDNNLKTEWF